MAPPWVNMPMSARAPSTTRSTCRRGVLDGATQAGHHPELAPFAAAKLVEADNVEVAAATEGEDDSPDIMRLQWTPDRHVVLQRGWAPFARAESTPGPPRCCVCRPRSPRRPGNP